MDIKNPNGYIKSTSKIIEFPADKARPVELADIVVEIMIADGTIITEYIPIESLRKTSKYVCTCTKNIDIEDLANALDALLEHEVSFYEKLGIKATIHNIVYLDNEEDEDE